MLPVPDSPGGCLGEKFEYSLCKKPVNAKSTFISGIVKLYHSFEKSRECFVNEGLNCLPRRILEDLPRY